MEEGLDWLARSTLQVTGSHGDFVRDSDDAVGSPRALPDAVLHGVFAWATSPASSSRTRSSKCRPTISKAPLPTKRLIRGRRKFDVKHKYAHVAQSWGNVNALRHGEFAEPLPSSAPAGRRRRVHRNRWSFKATLMRAYRSVGHHSASGKMGELGECRRHMEIVTAHASLARLALDSAFKRCFRPVGFCVVDIAYDATPRLVEFGAVHAAVSGHAR